MANFNLLYARDDDSRRDPRKNQFVPINQDSKIGVVPVTPNVQIPGIGIIAIPGTGTNTSSSSSNTTSNTKVELPDWLNLPSWNPTDSLTTQLKDNPNSLMYIQTQDGEIFWYFPTEIAGSSVNGYRWNQQAGWFPYSITLSTIKNIHLYQS